MHAYKGEEATKTTRKLAEQSERAKIVHNV